jgi:hypothetical protein
VEATSLEEVKQRINALWPLLAPIPPGSVPSIAPQLALEDYRGYNIIHLGDEFYGIRQDDGAFDIERFRTNEYLGGVQAASLEEVIRQIDNLVPPPEQLVQEGYKGYNIIQVGDRFFGIRQADGAFAVARFQEGGYTEGVEGASKEEVKRLIDEVSQS